MLINSKSFLFKILSNLFLFIPLLLITGPFLSDLALSIISLVVLSYFIYTKEFKFFKNRYVYFFLIFYTYIVFNSIFVNPNADSIRISLSYLRFGLFCLGTILILNIDENILKRLYFLYILIFSALIFDGFFQYFFGHNILGYPLHAGPRVSSFFNDELILGSYLARSFPIFFGLLVFLHNQLSKKLYFYSCIIFIFAEVLIYLSGERAAFFYMNLSSVFILIMIKDFKKLRLIIFTFSILFIVLISLIYPSAKNRIVDYSIHQMNLDREGRIFVFSKEHNDIYESAIKISKDNLLFGVGIKNFKNICKKEIYRVSKNSCTTHPHNTYLQFLTELGLIGLFFIIFIFLYFIKNSVLHLNKLINKQQSYFNDFEICLLSAVLICLWPIVPTGNFFNNWLGIISYYPIGILFWSLQRKLSTNNNCK